MACYRVETDPSVHACHKLFADRQAQAGAALLACIDGIDLGEFLEYTALRGAIDTRPWPRTFTRNNGLRVSA